MPQQSQYVLCLTLIVLASLKCLARYCSNNCVRVLDPKKILQHARSLACENGRPVGCCNAAFRYDYPGAHWLIGPRPDKGEKVGAIVCFVTVSTHRARESRPSRPRGVVSRWKPRPKSL